MELVTRFQFFSFTLFTSFISISASFTPTDNHLISCGSKTNTSVDNRIFIGDSTNPKFLSLSSTNSISLTNLNQAPSNSTSLYNTARVFYAPFSYDFLLKKTGLILVRFHFSPFNSQNFSLSSAVFGVSVNGLSLFDHFSASGFSLREFILKVDNKLEIVLKPEGKSGFGFVNAIEVFSAPDNLILDNGVKLLSYNGSPEEYVNATSHVFETVHRINVGGLKVTPFNDTLWRTWIPDDDYLVLKSAAVKVSIPTAPNYSPGYATREIAPDYVYMTAQEMNQSSTLVDDFNITWNFSVQDPVQHLVRLHFCDILKREPGQLYFNVYINGLMAYKDLDLSTITMHLIEVPYYVDCVVDGDQLGLIQVSVGPSSLSTSWKNAILNGGRGHEDREW
ncbi:hypothetical protein Ancab_009781 [Ancistrocladus abbreviatus]